MEETLKTVLVGLVMVGTMMMLVRGLFRVRPSGRFTGGGITAAGRATRFVIWRGPFGAMRRATAQQLALLTVEGQQWAALLGFGLWVSVLIWISWTINTFESVTAFLGLLWIWWFWRLLTRAAKRRRDAKMRMRYDALIIQGQVALVSQMKQLIASAGGGTATMLSSARHLGDEHDRMAAAQEEHLRGQAPEEPSEEWMRAHGLDPNMSTGENDRGWGGLPRWARRRKDK